MYRSQRLGLLRAGSVGGVLINFPPDSGEAVRSRFRPPHVDTADGESLTDRGMRLAVTAAPGQDVSVSSAEAVWYAADSAEISSGSEGTDQVIPGGQTLKFVNDEGSDPNPPQGAATCQVVSWSG